MHEVDLRRGMQAQIAAYKQHARPSGANVRPMTKEEQDTYVAFVADTYRELQSMDDPKHPRGRIEAVQAHVDDRGDGHPRETKDEIVGTYGGPNNALEVTQDLRSHRMYQSEDWGTSTTDMTWAEQNVAFVAGITLHRDRETLSGVQFFVDRRHPENSRIAEQEPAKAR